jgi:hypothetical protein
VEIFESASMPGDDVLPSLSLLYRFGSDLTENIACICPPVVACVSVATCISCYVLFIGRYHARTICFLALRSYVTILLLCFLDVQCKKYFIAGF